MLCTLPRKIGILVCSGLLIAALGLVLYCTFPILMKNEVLKNLVLEEGSQSYKYWKNIPVPIYIHFYFFNIVNTEEIWNLSSKPILEQMGPYTFREERIKVNITWNANGTITYRQVKRWYYQPDKTNGSLDDLVTTLNVPMMAMAAQGKKFDSEIVYDFMNDILKSAQSIWFVQKKVRELLFEGYDDVLMQLAKDSGQIPYDKFGWFYMRNDTDDGVITAYTGKNNIEQLDEIITWNYAESVTAYDPPCNMVKGSAGDMWPPNRTRNDQISIFIPDICRSIHFTYLSDVDYKGVSTYRYWADDKQLDNGKYNPKNKCFCSEGNCLPAGAVNVSGCKFNAPAVVSYPHFLFADSTYTQGVIGMHPNPKEHRMFLDIVPQMGVAVEVAARMQINIIFEANPNITRLENITSRIYFPIFWFSETAEAGDDILSQMKLVITMLPLISEVVSFFMVSVGAFLVLTAFVLSILYAMGKIGNKSGETKTLIVKD